MKDSLFDELLFTRKAFNDLARVFIKKNPECMEWLVLNYRDYLDETWFDEEICKEHNQVC